jgi:hypothetical protein
MREWIARSRTWWRGQRIWAPLGRKRQADLLMMSGIRFGQELAHRQGPANSFKMNQQNFSYEK